MRKAFVGWRRRSGWGWWRCRRRTWRRGKGQSQGFSRHRRWWRRRRARGRSWRYHGWRRHAGCRRRETAPASIGSRSTGLLSDPKRGGQPEAACHPRQIVARALMRCTLCKRKRTRNGETLRGQQSHERVRHAGRTGATTSPASESTRRRSGANDVCAHDRQHHGAGCCRQRRGHKGHGD